jgi:hypothetical protein
MLAAEVAFDFRAGLAGENRREQYRGGGLRCSTYFMDGSHRFWLASSKVAARPPSVEARGVKFGPSQPSPTTRSAIGCGR